MRWLKAICVAALLAAFCDLVFYLFLTKQFVKEKHPSDFAHVAYHSISPPKLHDYIHQSQNYNIRISFVQNDNSINGKLYFYKFFDEPINMFFEGYINQHKVYMIFGNDTPLTFYNNRTVIAEINPLGLVAKLPISEHDYINVTFTTKAME